MIDFFRKGWLYGIVFLVYFLLYFFIVPLDIKCTYHTTSNYCVGFTTKDTLPDFLPKILLPVDIGFFYPVTSLLGFLNQHLTPVDPNDTALIILLSSFIFYMFGNTLGYFIKKFQ